MIDRGLRFKATIAHLLLGATLASVFAVGISFVTEHMEETYVETVLTENLELMIDAARRGDDAAFPFSTALRGYAFDLDAGPAIPALLAGLEPGIYERTHEGREMQIAIRDHGRRRFALTYDGTTLERIEDTLKLGLTVGAIAFTYAALWLGHWISGRVVGPVTTLARRIKSLGDEPGALELSGEFGDDEIGDLARAFESYSRRLCAFIERERAFTSDVSHELRNPIMSASSAIELLLGDSNLDSTTRRRVERLERAVERMQEMVDVFLALAREPEPADLIARASLDIDAIAHTVVDRHRFAAQQKGLAIAIRTSGRPKAMGRASSASVVLENLVANAVRHTRTGRVDVIVDGDGAEVVDSGPGIAAEDRARVFERGFRGRGASLSGSGLGLSIVRRVCEHEDWSVLIDNAPDGGTRVRVRFAGVLAPPGTVPPGGGGAALAPDGAEPA